METIIQDLGICFENHVFLKREDLIPFSFGGNKARKAILFFEDFDRGEYDCVITYGSSSSNHCRIIANICASRQIDCYIISPKEASVETINTKMIHLFGAEILTVPVCDVARTIEKKLSELRSDGRCPYFIPGGGHGNIGTQAFVNCYEEIKHYKEKFDYIFFASGTGTTHAGLVAGKLLNKGKEKIVGISIARKNPRGKQVVLDSIVEYLRDSSFPVKCIDDEIIFIDKYVGNGYGSYCDSVSETIKEVLIKYGIPLDPTYTGKAFTGMKDYIYTNKIKGMNILFIHTGGTPLFFDILNKL